MKHSGLWLMHIWGDKRLKLKYSEGWSLNCPAPVSGPRASSWRPTAVRLQVVEVSVTSLTHCQTGCVGWRHRWKVREFGEKRAGGRFTALTNKRKRHQLLNPLLILSVWEEQVFFVFFYIVYLLINKSSFVARFVLFPFSPFHFLVSSAPPVGCFTPSFKNSN